TCKNLSLTVDGGSGGNRFVVGGTPAAGTVATLNGGSGSNTLASLSSARTDITTWSTSRPGSGGLGRGAPLAPIAHVVGGLGLDLFRFTSQGSLAGSLDGGGAPSKTGNWLDYSGLTSSGVAVNLQTGAATRVAGGAAGNVAHIQNVRGGNAGTLLT